MTAFKPHCSLNYHEFGGPELETFGHHVSVGIYDHNPPFTAPPVATKAAFEAVVATYHSAYEAYKNGGKDQKGDYLVARTNLITQLDTTAAYVDGLAGVDDDLITLAGYTPTKTGESQAVTPAVPSTVKIVRGVTGELKPECAPVTGAAFYGCILVADGPLPAGLSLNANGQIVGLKGEDSPPGPAVGEIALIIDVNKSRKKQFTGLTKGLDYYCYFYAGNSAGVSLLSEPEVMMCG